MSKTGEGAKTDKEEKDVVDEVLQQAEAVDPAPAPLDDEERPATKEEKEEKADAAASEADTEEFVVV